MGDKKEYSGLPDKKMCKIGKKEIIKEHIEEFKKVVKNPAFLCRKCGRVADKEERLCKPLEI